MNKIPVGATIAHAYSFAFDNALTMLKAIWLPMLAQLVVILLLTKRMAQFLAATQARDPSATSLFVPLLLLFPLLVIFIFAQFAAAMETALGRPPRSWLAFHFDKTMWRLLGGFMAALLAIIAIAGITLLILMAVAVGFNFFVKTAPGDLLVAGILTGLVASTFFCVLVFVFVRFLFLLAPINVSEQRLGVRRAWKLSAGNFWRVFMVTVAVILPVAIINYSYGIAMAGPLHIAPDASKDVVRTVRAALAAQRVTQLNAMADRWYLTLPLMGLLMLFQFGAGCAAQAFVYRALVPAETETEADAFD